MAGLLNLLSSMIGEASLFKVYFRQKFEAFVDVLANVAPRPVV